MLAFVRRGNDESNHKKPDGFDEIAKLAKQGSEITPMQILGACRDAEVPDVSIRSICHLLLTQSWPTKADETERQALINDVARSIVAILLQSTIHLDFIAWAIDDIPHADRLSWKVIELLHNYSCNFMLLMASRPMAGSDMNIELQFWEFLNDKGKEDGSFLHLELSPMTQDDVDVLVKNYAADKEWHASVELSDIAKEIFVQSGGIPHLAAQMLEGKSSRMESILKPQRANNNARGTRKVRVLSCFLPGTQEVS